MHPPEVINHNNLTMSQTRALITTKLNAPPIVKRMVDRTHLLNRLSEGRALPLIVISSPAGSGKTSLVCQWLLRENIPAAWYSLDDEDNDIETFFSYLTVAFDRFKDRTDAGKGGADAEDDRSTPEKRLYAIFQRIADPNEDRFLVLDDYQFITSRIIHSVLTYLLDHMPLHIHLVIISRYSVPLPIARLKVRNQVMEITMADMRFKKEEIQTLFNDIMAVPIDQEDARQLRDFSEGWVAALQLLGLSLKDLKVSDRLQGLFARAGQDISDYLINEVIDVQSEKMRDFLESTALLERFNPEVAVAVSGIDEAEKLIDQIIRNNLFLVPLDAERRWYRYHHLFSQAVQQRLKLLKPDLPRIIHQRAADWFATHGYLEDAFRSAFASGDMTYAADLLEDYLLHIIDRFEYASGGPWIAKLPHEVLMQRNLLRLHDCGQKIEALQLAEIEAVIKDIEADPDRAFQRYDGWKKRLCEDLLIYFGYVLRYYYHDPGHADVEQLEQAYQMISPENKIFSAYIMMLLTLAHIVRGRPLQADGSLDMAYPVIISSGGIWARIFWLRLKAVVERIKGNLHRSEEYLKEAYVYLAVNDLLDTPLQQMLNLPMAWVCYQRNDLDQALKYAVDAVAYGERVNFVRDMVEGHLVLALVYCARGDESQALAHVARMQRISDAWNAADLSVSADPWVDRIHMLLGRYHECRPLPAGRSPENQAPFSMRRIHEQLNLAERLYQQSRLTEATAVLETLHGQCTAHGMLESVLEIDLIRCGICHRLKDHDRAKSILERAIAFGEAEGYLRPFINKAPMIRPILKTISESVPTQPKPAFLNDLKEVCGLETEKPGVPANKTNILKTTLTLREYEVFKLIAEGRQNKDIAQQLSISSETVKSHIKQIYKKLNISSKMEAIRKAAELGLGDVPQGSFAFEKGLSSRLYMRRHHSQDAPTAITCMPHNLIIDITG